jgi:hypothetical protein
MAMNQARIDLLTYIRNTWTNTDIAFKGENDKKLRLAKGTDPWIYAYISWSKEKQLSAPAPKAKFARFALFASQIYVRKTDGTGLIHSITDDYFDILRSKQIGNISIGSPRIGNEEENSTWQVFFTTVDFKVYYEKEVLPV